MSQARAAGGHAMGAAAAEARTAIAVLAAENLLAGVMGRSPPRAVTP